MNWVEEQPTKVDNDFGQLVTEISDNNQRVLGYSRRRFLWTWLALGLLGLMTAVAIWLAIRSVEQSQKTTEAVAAQARHTADGAQESNDQIVAYMRGEQGIPGVPGANGQDGSPGMPGSSGTPGAEGPKGPKGDTGPAGAAGTAGSQGPAGTAGAVGPQGPQGAQGDPGQQGDPGKTGDPGSQGMQGVQGVQGAAGPAGPPGPQGAQGPVGPQGPPGGCPEGTTLQQLVIRLDPEGNAIVAACVVTPRQ